MSPQESTPPPTPEASTGQHDNERSVCKLMKSLWQKEEERQGREVLGDRWTMRLFKTTASGRKEMGDNTCPDYLAEWRNSDTTRSWIHFFEVKVISRSQGTIIDPAKHYGKVYVDEITEYHTLCDGLTVGLEVLSETQLDATNRKSHEAFVERWRKFCETSGIGLWLFWHADAGFEIKRLVACPKDSPSWVFEDKEHRQRILCEHIPPDLWPIEDESDDAATEGQTGPTTPLVELRYVMRIEPAMDERCGSCKNVHAVCDRATTLISKVEGRAEESVRATARLEHPRYETSNNISQLRKALKKIWEYHRRQCDIPGCVVTSTWPTADSFNGAPGRPSRASEDAEKAKRILEEYGYGATNS